MSSPYLSFANWTKGSPGCSWSGFRVVKVDVLSGSCFLPYTDTNTRLLESQWSGFGGSRLVVSVLDEADCDQPGRERGNQL